MPARRYWQAGLTVLDRLLDEPYLSTDPTTRACSCTPSTTARTAGTTSRPGAKVPRGEIQHVGRLPRSRGSPCTSPRLVSNGPYHAFFRI